MREVAELANVAISSVSRVLSNHPDVSPAMRARVLAAVRQLEYEPDFLAQSLRRGATLSVGFVVGDISNPLMADIVSGAESELRGAGYSILLMNSENDPSLDVAHVRFFLSRRVDGLILSLASERDPRTLELLRTVDVPIVVVDRDVPPDVRASAVLSDHRAGITAAVNHLLDLGHRRIALIAGSLEVRPGHARLSAMREAMASRGLPDTTVAIAGTFSAEHGEAATNELLKASDPPTAIIVGSNQLLVGCLRALRRHGKRVGEDISIVTCDDIPLVDLYQPPIASISRDSVELGRTAARLLLRRLRNEAGPEVVINPTVFTPRESIRPVESDRERGAPAAASTRH
jgi:LacI family transcriptional regulator